MPPLHDINNWKNRNASVGLKPIFSRVFFICEGENTEVFYFESLFGILRDQGHPVSSELVICKRTGEHKHTANPKNLMRLAEDRIARSDFDKTLDSIIVVYDLDIYHNFPDQYSDLLKNCVSGVINCVTNPSFELFLLLHRDNALSSCILPNKEKLLHEARYAFSLFKDTFGFNPKALKNKQKVMDLAGQFEIAVEQEQQLNQICEEGLSDLTSNIGVTISNLCKQKDMIKDGDKAILYELAEPRE